MAAPNALPDPDEPDDVPGPSAEPVGDPSQDDHEVRQDHEAPSDRADGVGDDRVPVDVDTQWAGIVAGLEELSDLDAEVRGAERGAPGPPARDAPTSGPGRAPGRDPLGSVPVAPWVRSSGPRDWPATPEVEAIEEAESHFVPPDPPLVLGRDPLLTMAWSLVVGVPVLLLVLLVVARPFPVVAAQVGGAAFLAGLAVLLWRMPHRRDDDRGPGAVV